MEGQTYYKRTIDDVRTIIKHAKLDEKNLTPITQTIYFPNENVESSNLKLIELNPYLLKEIEKGGTLCFKGGLHDKAVLCTDDKTFEVKEAEISNSLLVVPDVKFAQSTSRSPLKSPKNNQNRSLDRSIEDEEDIEYERVLERREVLKIFHDYYECREIKPRYRKLYDLLQVTRYSGPENEYCIDRKCLFSFNQFFDTIQCSRQEFINGLKIYRAFEIDGYIRILECEYEHRVIALMTDLIKENSWSPYEIDRDETVRSLEGIIPIEIIANVFDIYTEPSEAIEGKYMYKEDMVCRIIAEHTLQQGIKFHANEFLEAWQGVVPEGFIVKESYLRGIGIIDRTAKPPCVRALSELNLPINLHDRLRILFKTKEKWLLDEIEPYIECFSSNDSPVTGILSKFTRAMTLDGKRYYMAKH